MLSRSYCEERGWQPKAGRKPAQQPAGGPEQVYFRFSAVFDAQGNKNRPGAIQNYCEKENGSQKPAESRPSSRQAAPSGSLSEPPGEGPRASESPPAKLNVKYVRSVCKTGNHEAEARGTTLGITKP